MVSINPTILLGAQVQLEPLNQSHFDILNTIAQDQRIWTFTATNASGENFQKWFDKAMDDFQNQDSIPFVVKRLSDQKILGCTRYYHIDTAHHRLSIGYTWYIPEVWGSFVNPECKYLLLQHAFESLNINRVEFTIDSRNVRSLAAVKKLGATEEGTLRQHMILENGFVRDTVVLSIIQSEWPQIKIKLQERLEK